MSFDIENYLPFYPQLERDSFYQQIVQKKEFLDHDDPVFFKHQVNIARFLSPKTLYDSLLLIHEMGTGKTATAIATIQLIRSQDEQYKRVVVLANGRTQLQVFRDEIFRRVPALLDKVTSLNVERNTVLRREGFVFDTYRTFAKDIQALSPTLIRSTFEHTIFVMDEIHNLTSSKPGGSSSNDGGGGGGITNTKAYTVLYNMVHTLQHRKLLCMTGTPIRDQPFEIAKLLNLVVPRSVALPVGKAFLSEFFTVKTSVPLLGDIDYPLYEWKAGMRERFQSIIRGYTSYLKRELPSYLRVSYQENPAFPTGLKAFRVYGHLMSSEQSRLYLENFIRDLESGKPTEEKEEGEEGNTPMVSSPTLAYFRSRQASLFVFPSGGEEEDTVGKQVTEKYLRYIPKTSDKSMLSGFGWKPAMNQLFPKNKGIQERLDWLSRYSTIYAFLITQILKHPNELVYIYSFLKSGSGMYLFASFLIHYFNFELVTSIDQLRSTPSTTHKRRVVILNGDFFTDSQLKTVIDLLNEDGNATGSTVQVIIGTKQTKEGITLKNIRQIHIVQPEWNYADISQALARGIRVGSHEALKKRLGSDTLTVRVYQHAAIPREMNDEDGGFSDSPDYATSVDLEQYRRSEVKDMNIKLVERSILEASWDCDLHRERNTGLVDGSRECEYTECRFRCVGISPSSPPPPSQPIDYSTYNAYYSLPAVESLKEQLRRLWRTRPIFSSDALISQITTGEGQDDDHNTALKASVVESIVQQAVLNRMGLPSYIQRTKTTKDLYYLQGHPYQGGFSDFYFYDHHILATPCAFETLVSNLSRYRIGSVLWELTRYFLQNPKDHNDYCIYRITRLPVVCQTLILEHIIAIMHSPHAQNQNPFQKAIFDHYQNQKRVVVSASQRLITLVLQKNKKRYYHLDTHSWSDDQPPLLNTPPALLSSGSTIIENSPAFNRIYIDENPYGMYGIVEVGPNETVFKIRDVHDKALVYGKNKSKIPKGELCGKSFSRKKDGLIRILLHLGYDVQEGASSSVTTTLDAIKKQFLDPKNSSLHKLYNNIITPPAKDMHLKPFAKDSERAWRALDHLSTMKLPELCTITRRRLEELGLIFTKSIL